MSRLYLALATGLLIGLPSEAGEGAGVTLPEGPQDQGGQVETMERDAARKAHEARLEEAMRRRARGRQPKAYGDPCNLWPELPVCGSAVDETESERRGDPL